MRRFAPTLWLSLVCGALELFGACGSSTPEQPATGRDPARAQPPAPAPAPPPPAESADTPGPAALQPPPPGDGPGIRVGDIAPTFSLPDDTGTQLSLEQYRDQRAVLLAFYPKDFTGG
jgi:hypothetical protein